MGGGRSMILDEIFSSGGGGGRCMILDSLFSSGGGLVVYIHRHALQTRFVALCLSSRTTKNGADSLFRIYLGCWAVCVLHDDTTGTVIFCCHQNTIRKMSKMCSISASRITSKTSSEIEHPRLFTTGFYSRQKQNTLRTMHFTVHHE